jgi:dienelactone hydrolase
LLLTVFGALALTAAAVDQDPTRVLEPGRLPEDARLGKLRDLNGYFPMSAPGDLTRWRQRRRELREQVLVATGLWPMPERAPIWAVIHGKMDRDDYSVEKVFFASYPGHYVSGNLYRPKNGAGKHAGVLCPHGHWQDGRFYEASEAEAQAQIAQGAEKTMAGARYPLQARCVQLARMGCVVFHFDMVGYADSRPIFHREGFLGADALLRLQSVMGLQTYNSIRALDFLAGLPDVDPARIGVTGASGGGTQTFILCAIDDRPAAAFPAVMVSTAMQGGCVCENAPYLRVGTGNIELAGLFAPKPLGMTGANDWTIDIERKGLPELKALYRLYQADNRVMARCYPMFGHNYNQVSRELMYNWFNEHLHLGQPAPVSEKPFTPLSPKELSVYDEGHPLPGDAVDAERLRRRMSEISDRQVAAFLAPDSRSSERYRELVGAALRVMVGDGWPAATGVSRRVAAQSLAAGARLEKFLLGRKGAREEVPAVLLEPARFSGRVVVWVHPQGKASLYASGELVPAARALLGAGAAILAPDVFLTGEFAAAPRPAINPHDGGFTFCYNRTLLGNRAHDILTTLAFAGGRPGTRAVDVIGFAEAGPWALIACALAPPDALHCVAIDCNWFSFDQVRSCDDPMMLPGALKYGGIEGLVRLCAPKALLLHDDPKARASTDASFRVTRRPERLDAVGVVHWAVSH